jgi:hypothetical protein
MVHGTKMVQSPSLCELREEDLDRVSAGRTHVNVGVGVQVWSSTDQTNTTGELNVLVWDDPKVQRHIGPG